MSAYRNTPALARNVLCAFVACALTVVLWGEVGKSAAQAAQRARAEQSVNDGTVVIGEDVGARPIVLRAALI